MYKINIVYGNDKVPRLPSESLSYEHKPKMIIRDDKCLVFDNDSYLTEIINTNEVCSISIVKIKK